MNSGTSDCQTDFGYPPNFAELDLDGISYRRSMICLKEVINGTSHTYLAGEKYLNPDNYTNGMAWDDNECLYMGWDDDLYRSGYWPPSRDQRGYTGPGCSFGSAATPPCGTLPFAMARCTAYRTTSTRPSTRISRIGGIKHLSQPQLAGKPRGRRADSERHARCC